MYALSKVNYLGVNSTNLAKIVTQGPAVFNRSESIFNMYELFLVRVAGAYFRFVHCHIIVA